MYRCLLNIFKAAKSKNSLGNPQQCTVTFTVIPDVHKASPVYELVAFASGPVIGYNQKEPGSIFFVPSLQVFIYTDLPELFFSEWTSLSSLTMPSYGGCSSSPITLVGLCWTLSNSSEFLLYQEAQKWTQYSRYL